MRRFSTDCNRADNLAAAREFASTYPVSDGGRRGQSCIFFEPVLAKKVGDPAPAVTDPLCLHQRTPELSIQDVRLPPLIRTFATLWFFLRASDATSIGADVS